MWCFKMNGLLRINSVSHKLCNSSISPPAYTINDCVSYDISELTITVESPKTVTLRSANTIQRTNFVARIDFAKHILAT